MPVGEPTTARLAGAPGGERPEGELAEPVVVAVVEAGGDATEPSSLFLTSQSRAWIAS